MPIGYVTNWKAWLIQGNFTDYLMALHAKMSSQNIFIESVLLIHKTHVTQRMRELCFFPQTAPEFCNNLTIDYSNISTTSIL
jgi:hypothetical protein